jgi:hypothetical protein
MCMLHVTPGCGVGEASVQYTLGAGSTLMGVTGVPSTGYVGVAARVTE